MSEVEPSLLRSLINAAEKASNIARLCRSNTELLRLLVQEKTGSEANQRFEHDFKTLADVLIQETIKRDVGALFPAMREAIKGEESPTFTNTSGETVHIVVGASAEATRQMLAAVLCNNLAASEALSMEIHREVKYAATEELPALPIDLDYSKLGIWIDPIDATAEYITGDSIFTNFPGITSTGLDCVTVLIGVYDRTTGEPVIGVISQPFSKKLAQNDYKSLLFWGVALPELQANNCAALLQLSAGERAKLLSILSSSENADILRQLLELGYEFAFAAGAGHKALKVITAEADLYLLSKGSTYKWDTCAPQAILRSLGGNIYNYRDSVAAGKPLPLNYLEPAENAVAGDWRCNDGGLIAVRNLSFLESLLAKLSNA